MHVAKWGISRVKWECGAGSVRVQPPSSIAPLKTGLTTSAASHWADSLCALQPLLWWNRICGCSHMRFLSLPCQRKVVSGTTWSLWAESDAKRGIPGWGRGLRQVPHCNPSPLLSCQHVSLYSTVATSSGGGTASHSHHFNALCENINHCSGKCVPQM